MRKTKLRNSQKQAEQKYFSSYSTNVLISNLFNFDPLFLIALRLQVNETLSVKYACLTVLDFFLFLGYIVFAVRIVDIYNEVGVFRFGNCLNIRKKTKNSFYIGHCVGRLISQLNCCLNSWSKGSLLFQGFLPTRSCQCTGIFLIV